MKIKNKFLYREFLNREKDIPRASYIPELEFYNAIKAGDVKKVTLLCQESFSAKSGLGELSPNPLQNLKYHFAITAGILARYCIEGGMDLGEAYNLSDYYIHTADSCSMPDQISSLHLDMCLDYTKRMRALEKRRIVSRKVVETIEIIYDNLHKKITVDYLANKVNLSNSYLSTLFKKEVGIPISAYVQQKKLEVAKNMLSYSEYSISDIAALLAYPSHSYFTEVFRKEFGITPLQYRNQNHHKISS